MRILVLRISPIEYRPILQIHFRFSWAVLNHKIMNVFKVGSSEHSALFDTAWKLKILFFQERIVYIWNARRILRSSAEATTPCGMPLIKRTDHKFRRDSWANEPALSLYASGSLHVGCFNYARILSLKKTRQNRNYVPRVCGQSTVTSSTTSPWKRRFVYKRLWCH